MYGSEMSIRSMVVCAYREDWLKPHNVEADLSLCCSVIQKFTVSQLLSVIFVRGVQALLTHSYLETHKRVIANVIRAIILFQK